MTMNDNQSIQPGLYKHYKGNEYTVLGTARHSESQEEMVVYRQEYDEHSLWGGAEFVGASQLIIYVGGTMVLVVFGVMLTAQGPFQKLTSHPQEMVVGGILAVALFALLVNSALHMNSPSQPESTQKTVTVGALGSAFLNVPNVGATPVDGPQSAGSYKRHEIGYLLPFEIVSVHLLVVLIGAAYLARAKRKKPQTVIPAPMLESQDDRSDVRETLIH